MIKNGKGGANTRTGLLFEERIDLVKLFEKIEGYEIEPADNKAGHKFVLPWKRNCQNIQKI